MNYEENTNSFQGRAEPAENWGSTDLNNYDDANKNVISQENWLGMTPENDTNAQVVLNLVDGSEEKLPKHVVIKVDGFQKRIIENILNDEEATTSIKKKHFRNQPGLPGNSRYN